MLGISADIDDGLRLSVTPSVGYQITMEEAANREDETMVGHWCPIYVLALVLPWRGG